MNQSYQLARDHVAFFDLQTEGHFKISGANAQAALNELFSIDLASLRPWKGVMGLFLTEAAKFIAIATVFKTNDEFFVFTETRSAAALRSHLAAEIAARNAVAEDLGDSHAWLAVVGPRAQDTMVKAGGEDVIGLPYLSCEDNALIGGRVFRMGNTGEFEYRVLADIAQREATTNTLLSAGAGFGIGQADPAILETLMLEMRSLSAKDLPDDADPIAAGLHWMIGFRKPDLRGGEILNARKREPLSRAVMVCLQNDGQADNGDRLAIENQDVGFLASVTYSPTLEKYIGLAFVTPELGWVGVPFNVKSKSGLLYAKAVSAPLFLTKTAQTA